MLITNIAELVTAAGPDKPRIGQEMSNLQISRNASIAILKDRILEVGKESELIQKYDAEKIIDAKGGLVTPGFVDPHTHPVFACTREEEFEMRVKGATYTEIAKAGGGIRNSARKLQNIPKNQLKEASRERILEFLNTGTTTIEAKSGYGLSTDSEIKSLEIIIELEKELELDIIPTFLGAHEIPDTYQNNREEYIRILIEEMIPIVAQRKLAKYCDIFCEDHVFNIEESRKILKAAKKHGLELKLHADELVPLGGAELSAELGAVSADHLVAISQEGIESMVESKVIAVLLPATTFYLGSSKYAPARKMIEAGVAVALSSDFNPGSSVTQSMPLVLTIASLYLKMTPAEAIIASTINSACAIGMEKEVGSIVAGKKADIVIWSIDNYKKIAYHFGHNFVRKVIKAGKIVVNRS